MGVDISAGDILTMCKLKNTDATSHLHIDQRNLPSAAQISVVVNKEITVLWKELEAKNEGLQEVLIVNAVIFKWF